MARAQEFRGNPEVKRYELHENFSGGINTTDTDGMMYSNEFRHLENIELIERGIIQNRRGFKYNTALNEILEPFYDSVLKDARKVVLFKLIKEEGNALDIIKESSDLDDFKYKMIGRSFNIQFLVFVEHEGELKLFRIQVTNDNQSNDVLFSYEEIRVWQGVVTYKNIVEMPTVKYNDKIYLSLNVVSKDLVGIIEYNTKNDIIKVYDGGSDTFVPNPYEVSNVGFNAFLNDPLDIRLDNTGFAEVRGLYITKVGNASTILKNIPPDGIFSLYIIVRGDIVPEDLLVRVYTNNNDGSKRYLESSFTNVTNLGGRIKFDANIRIDGNRNIFIEVAKKEPKDPSTYFDIEFASGVALFNYFSVNRPKIALRTKSRAAKVFDPHETNVYGYQAGFLPESNIPDTENPSILAAWLENKVFPENYPPPGYLWTAFNITNKELHSAEIPIFFTGDTTAPNASSGAQHALRFNSFTVSNSNKTNYDNAIEGNRYFISYDFGLVSEENAKYYTYMELISNGFARNNLEIHFQKPKNMEDPNDIELNYYFQIVDFDNIAKLGFIKVDSTGNKGLNYLRYSDVSHIESRFVESRVNYTYKVVNDNEFEKLIPNAFHVYKIGSKFYSWKGTQLGDINNPLVDFEEITDSIETEETITSFINYYSVLSEDDTIEIESIDKRNFKMIEIKDRLVIYGGNTIWFSDLYKFSYFPNFNYITLALDNHDEIQKIAYFRGQYIIFTRERIYRMSGEFGTADFRILLVSDEIGCVSSESVRGINNTLVFLSRDGLYTIKQSFFMEALENVEKIDKQIKGLIPYGENYESLLYNEQYILLIKNNIGQYVKTVKQYYNMEYAKGRYPYVVDTYAKSPEFLTKLNNDVYAINNGLIFVYDLGYTDFMEPDTIEEDKSKHFYKCIILTSNFSMSYPTHDKKVKNFFIKTDSFVSIPLYITVFVNGLVWRTSHEYAAILNEVGEIEYREILGREDIMTTENAESNLVLSTELTPVETIDPDLTLGFVELGEMKLGLERDQLHKILTGAKGKTFALRIVQKTDDYFAIKQIGAVYKLGKVKESR
jgi:hypothetical protein